MKTISTTLVAFTLLPAILLTSCKPDPAEKKATQPTPEVSQEFGTSKEGSVTKGDSDPGRPGSGNIPTEEEKKAAEAEQSTFGNTGGPAAGNAEAGFPGKEKADKPGTGAQAPPAEVPAK